MAEKHLAALYPIHALNSLSGIGYLLPAQTSRHSGSFTVLPPHPQPRACILQLLSISLRIKRQNITPRVLFLLSRANFAKTWFGSKPFTSFAEQTLT